MSTFPCTKFSTNQSNYLLYDKLIDIQTSTKAKELENMFKNLSLITDSITGTGATILAQAVEVNNVPLVEDIVRSPSVWFLIDCGDIYGHTPLHRAAIHANSASIKILMTAGANLNIETTKDYLVEGYIKAGTTPLWIAAFSNVNPETLKLLMANGAVCKGAIMVPNAFGGQEEADKINRRVANVIKQAKL